MRSARNPIHSVITCYNIRAIRCRFLRCPRWCILLTSSNINSLHILPERLKKNEMAKKKGLNKMALQKKTCFMVGINHFRLLLLPPGEGKNIHSSRALWVRTPWLWTMKILVFHEPGWVNEREQVSGIAWKHNEHNAHEIDAYDTGPFACSLAHSLTPLTHTHAPHCSLRSLARSLTRSRAHGKEVYVYEVNASIS